MLLPPSGRQCVLVHGDDRAVVVEVGGGLRTLRLGGQEVLDGYAEAEMASSGRGQVLAPWPNRLRDGRYRWDGRDLQLAVSEPATATAIHGLVRFAAFAVVAQTESEVVLQHVLHPSTGYPFRLGLTVGYRLGEDGLTVTTTARNLGDAALPFAWGQHPYLDAGGPVDACTLQVGARTRLVVDERSLPTGRAPLAGTPYDFSSPRPVGDLVLDTACTDLDRDADGRAWVTLTRPGGAVTRLWADAACGYLQLFTGDTVPDPARRRRSLAVEPMTAPADALASGEGLLRVEPGAEVTTRWGLATG